MLLNSNKLFGSLTLVGTSTSTLTFVRGFFSLFFLWYFSLILYQGSYFFSEYPLYKHHILVYWRAVAMMGSLVSALTLLQIYLRHETRWSLLILTLLYGATHFSLSGDQAGKFTFIILLLTFPLKRKVDHQNQSNVEWSSIPLILFLGIFYIIVGLEKWNRIWLDEAVAFSRLAVYPILTTELGKTFFSFIQDFKVANHSIVILEIALGISILVSIFSYTVRSVSILIMIIFHLMLMLLIDVGYFPLFSLIAALLIFPSKKILNFPIQRNLMNFFKTMSPIVFILFIIPNSIFSWDLISKPSPKVQNVSIEFLGHSRFEKIPNQSLGLIDLDQKGYSLINLGSNFYGPIWHFFFFDFVTGLGGTDLSESDRDKFRNFVRKFCSKYDLSSVRLNIQASESQSHIFECLDYQ